MTGVERVFATVQGQPTDHPAATATLSLYGARLTGCPLREYYTNPARYVEGQLAIRKTFQPDILFTPFVLAAEGEAFGSHPTYFEKNPPNITDWAANSAEAALRLPLPDPDAHPRLRYLRDATRQLVAQCAHDTAIAGVLLSPIDLPPLFMGLDNWLQTLLFEEDAAQKILERATQFFIQRANAFFADGVHVVALPLVFCNPLIVTPHIMRELALPVLRDAFQQVRGLIVAHHGGNPIVPFIEMLAGLPNVAAIVVDQYDRLEAARAAMGAAKTLLGNIDGPTLGKHSPDAIRQRCQHILRNRQADPRFILATSGADVAFDTPPECIHALFDSARCS